MAHPVYNVFIYSAYNVMTNTFYQVRVLLIIIIIILAELKMSESKDSIRDVNDFKICVTR